MVKVRQKQENRRVAGGRLRWWIWGAAALALVIPLIAMQFTAEVNWTLSDFVVFGVMLLFACGGYELGCRLAASRDYRLALGIALLGTFLLVWANLAVGIVGSEQNPINRLFLAVPAVGIVAALLARFEARGMSRALLAVAVTQLTVALVVWLGGWGSAWLVSFFFLALWLASARLFAVAAHARPGT